LTVLDVKARISGLPGGSGTAVKREKENTCLIPGTEFIIRKKNIYSSNQETRLDSGKKCPCPECPVTGLSTDGDIR